MKKILFLLYLLLVTGISFGQPGTYPESFKQNASCETSAVYMMNEAVHGLLIVQRIFENDNQTLNKYADKESQRINFYGNEDLPKNVFEDPEHWFYAVTPYEWLKSINTRCSSKSSNITSKLNDTKTLLESINQMRFSLDDAMRTKDLSKLDEITTVYKMMENAAQQCENLLSQRNQLQGMLSENLNTFSPIQQDLIKTISPLYIAAEQLILAIRSDNEPKVRKQLASLIEANKVLIAKQTNIISALAKSSGKSQVQISLSIENIKARTSELLKEANAYLGDAAFDNKYSAYGRNYYYYNVKLLSLFNKYGKGLVFELNQLLILIDAQYHGFLELPHYVKIIYPEKQLEVERAVVKTEKVEVLPTELRNRRVVQRQQSITADGPECLIEISDNQEVDGDIVSINFNGTWIIENYPLKKEALKIPIILNREGQNFLLLHAENEGTTPPNTILINYTLNGQRKRVILNSTVKESEMIQIKPNIKKSGQ
jgi:hypothetical protein